MIALKDQLIMEIKDQNVEDVVDEMFRTGDKRWNWGNQYI